MNQKEAFTNPNYKIGIKELTFSQLTEALPNYDALLDKIAEIRRESVHVDKGYFEKNYFEILKYDNIFSILGGRGSGKTSVLFSLYKRFKMDESNIMIPIVMPELLDKDENIVSWIISAIEIGLDEIEEKIKKSYNDQPDCQKLFEQFNFFDRCVFNNDNKLRNQFNQLKFNFYNNVNKNFGNNYSENTELMAQSTQSGFELIPQFIKFWNTLISAYEQFLRANGINTAPLVFLFIDDADLKPEIINDLLFVIPKYLSHPNVVVFISGSQLTLSLAVKYHMYKSITHHPYDLMALMDIENKYNGESYRNETTSHIKFSELRYGKEYYRIDKLSNEILRKLFPVYNRFRITKYDSFHKKQSFQIFKDDTADCDESIKFSEKISQLLSGYYNECMQLHQNNIEKLSIDKVLEPSEKTCEEKRNNFSKLFQLNEQDKDLEYGFYLSFFGNYARDITAVYFSLKELLGSLLSILKKLYGGKYGEVEERIPLVCIEKTHTSIIKFLNSAITSNQDLKIFCQSIEDMIKTQVLHWQLYVDYSKVLEIFKQNEYYKNNMKNPEPFIEAFSLLSFIEQLVVVMMPQRRKCHGITELRELINSIGINVIQYDDSVESILQQYYVFRALNIVPKFDINKVEHQNNFINGIVRLNLLNRIEDHSSSIDREWLMLFTEVIYRRYSYIARLYKYRSKLMIFNDKLFLDNLYLNLRNNYYNYLKWNLFGKKCEIVTNDNQVCNITDVIVEMENQLLILNDSIKNLRLDYKKDDNDSRISNQISYVDIFDNMRLKKELGSFIDYINENSIMRYNITQRMNTISAIIENDSEDYLNLREWYHGFENLLNEKLKIKVTKAYSDYRRSIRKIRGLYQAYIDLYVLRIQEEITKENRNSPLRMITIDDNANSIIKILMNNLEEREWDKFLNAEL